MNEIEINEANDNQISQTIEQREDDIKEAIESLFNIEDMIRYLGFSGNKINGYSQKEKILEMQDSNKTFDTIKVNSLNYDGNLKCDIIVKISFEDDSEINVLINTNVSINIMESDDGPMDIDFSSIEFDVQNIDYINPENN